MVHRIKKEWWRLSQLSYLLYLLPAVIFYLVFLISPIFSNFYNSLMSWDGISQEKAFIGFNNFRYIFEDPVFVNSIKTTMLCVLFGPIVQTSLSLILAVFIANVLIGKTLYRALFYLPVILSLVAASIVWFNIYNPTFGVLNSIIRLFVNKEFHWAWLGETSTALAGVLVISIWRWTGFNIVIFMAGLQDISAEYYEAARIDGAGIITILRKITIPLLSSSIIINFLLNLIGYLKLFDIIQVTTKGGPAHATEVISTYIYKQAFQYTNIGMASAASVILFFIIVLFSSAYLSMVKRA
jgi:ABC-type sugar transport system permease subunit